MNLTHSEMEGRKLHVVVDHLDSRDICLNCVKAAFALAAKESEKTL